MSVSAGELIKCCRKFTGMTQKALADKSGVSAEMISYYERCECEPRFDTVEWILRACGFELIVIRKDDDNTPLYEGHTERSSK